MKRAQVLILALFTGFLFCAAAARPDDPKSSGPAPADSRTANKQDKGIGPVKELKLGPLDPALAKSGEALYSAKCLICHDLKQKKLGPPLGDITGLRSPEFIVNYLLNPLAMQQQDSIIKSLVPQYSIKMPNQNLAQDQARSILEYLRSKAGGK